MTPDENIIKALPTISNLYNKECWVDLISICNSSSDEELDPSIRNLLRFVCYIYLDNIQTFIGLLASEWKESPANGQLRVRQMGGHLSSEERCCRRRLLDWGVRGRCSVFLFDASINLWNVYRTANGAS